jgi:hypothetical protein
MSIIIDAAIREEAIPPKASLAADNVIVAICERSPHSARKVNKKD